MDNKKIDKYQILEKIASGTQGSVSRAFDVEVGRLVAIKILRPSLVDVDDDSFIKRFRREAELTASVNHPNVVRIFDTGQDGDQHFIIMEFLPETLFRLMEHGEFSVSRAVSLAAGIADGLGAIHKLGIVHRDMKPQNVLITPEGVPKITDFGIARDETQATITQDGVMMGTPHYMSPEQAKGNRADARSDVYALGCITYQMLTGTVPFSGGKPLAVLNQHIEQQARPIATRKGGVPPALARVVERAMDKNPDLRYSNGSEMAVALRAALPRIARTPRPSPARPSPRSRPARPSSPPAAAPLDQVPEARKRVLAEENRAADARMVARQRRRPSALKRLFFLGLIAAVVAAIIFWPSRDGEIGEVVPSLLSPEVAAAIDAASVGVKRPGIVTIVVDTSASMGGGKIQQAKDGLKRALEAMPPNNQVGLLSFGDTVRPGVSVGPLTVENQRAISAEIDDLEAKGETALYDAIRAGIEMTDSVAGEPNSIRAVVVLTDGQANKGETRLDDIIHMSSPGGTPIPSFSGFENVVLARDQTGRRVDKRDIVGSSLAMDTNHPVQIFFIGIGEDADIDVGRMLAGATGASFQGTTEEDLANLLEKFFKDF